MSSAPPHPATAAPERRKLFAAFENGTENADIAEKVEAQVRENLLRQSIAEPHAPARAAERPIAVSADDFDDED